MKKCTNGHMMKNLGNVDNIHYTSNPPQWDEVYVCHKCKEKITVRVYGKSERNIVLTGYKEIK